MKILKKIKNSNLFRSFIIFSIFRFFYGFIVLFFSYYFTTEYKDGIYFTVLFLLISVVFSRFIFKKIKVEISKAEYDKAFAEGRGEYHFTDVARTKEYKANNPDHMDYYKLEDTDELIGTTYTNEKVPGVKVDDFDGEVAVTWENDYSQPVAIQYVKPGMQGPDLGRLDKFEAGFADKQLNPDGAFAAVDQEVFATDPDGGFDTNAVVVE